MQFKTLLVSAAAAGLASAAPTENGNIFKGIAIAESTEVHQQAIQAATSHIQLAIPKQGASCPVKTEEATFHLTSAGELFLYSNAFPKQQLWVDRSGMGQGVMGYTTGVQGTPRNAERTGFSVKDNELTFDGQSFSACPNAEFGWTAWVGAGIGENCIPFKFQTTKPIPATPITCLYTS